MVSITKTKDGWLVVGGLLSYYEMTEFGINILRVINGRGVLTEELPQPYSPLGPQAKTIPSKHAGRSKGDEAT